MRDELADLLRERQFRHAEKLKCCMPMGHGGRTPFDRLRHIRDLDDFPRLLASSEHGNAQSWGDLADPVYRGEIAMSGWRPDGARQWRSFNQFFLVAVTRLLGDDRLRGVLANLAGLTHSAQMPRLAGTANSLAAIYVLPWSLADLCPRRDRTQVVWPSEGALAFPLWMTAQTAHRDRLAPVADYFFAPATARWLDHNRYPSLAPGASSLPKGARLAWPGWDFLRHKSTAKEIKRIKALFHAVTEKLDLGENQCA
jgi:ABC-type Fe3+ transport system substrate-binding protein